MTDDDREEQPPPPGLDYHPRPLAAGRALVWGCSAALLIAICIAGIAFAFLAAHI